MKKASSSQEDFSKRVVAPFNPEANSMQKRTLQSSHDPSLMKCSCLSNDNELLPIVYQLAPCIGELLRTAEGKKQIHPHCSWVRSPIMCALVEAKIGDGKLQILFNGSPAEIHVH